MVGLRKYNMIKYFNKQKQFIMKTPIITIILISLLGIFACNISNTKNANTETAENKRVPLKTVEEAISYISTNFKDQEETLWIADSLNDSVGMNMAIIGDKLLKTGYMPNGFDQKEGYRIYKYKKFE